MFYNHIYSTGLIRLQCVSVNVILKMFACGQIFQFQRKSFAKFSSIQTVLKRGKVIHCHKYIKEILYFKQNKPQTNTLLHGNPKLLSH